MGDGLSGFESPLRHHLLRIGVILRGYAFCFVVDQVLSTVLSTITLNGINFPMILMWKVRTSLSTSQPQAQPGLGYPILEQARQVTGESGLHRG